MVRVAQSAASRLVELLLRQSIVSLPQSETQATALSQNFWADSFAMADVALVDLFEQCCFQSVIRFITAILSMGKRIDSWIHRLGLSVDATAARGDMLMRSPTPAALKGPVVCGDERALLEGTMQAN